MEESFELISTGYPSLDYILVVDHLPEAGETGILKTPFTIERGSPGGCAANIAVGCSRMGLSSAVAVPLGRDAAGDEFLRVLREEGVDDRLVQRVADRYSSSTLLFQDGEGNHQTFFYPGAADAERFELPDQLPAVSGAWGVITVGNPQANLQVARWMDAQGCTLVSSFRRDPHSFSSELVEYLLEHSGVLVMNEHEADWIASRHGMSHISEAIGGPLQLVVITCGHRGADYYALEDSTMVHGHERAAEPKRIVDTTGAGDAFVSGLLTSLTMKKSYREALRFASVVSSFVLEELGCQTNLPTAEAAAERYRQQYGNGFDKK